jgi:hypothetical protein
MCLNWFGAVLKEKKFGKWRYWERREAIANNGRGSS